ncbi:hypothetical protein [Kiloniella sp.]|uniref:hypothetical protein n=1 Tax=Kiloniella sp. TaxID=1938587 RepID=UPI003A90CBA0
MLTEITEYTELLALHKALLEAKFCALPSNPDVALSPVVSNLHQKIINQLIKYEIEVGGVEAKSKWDEWLLISPQRLEWRAAVKRAAEKIDWDDLPLNEKEKYSKILVVPFFLDNEELGIFIDHASLLHQIYKNDQNFTSSSDKWAKAVAYVKYESKWEKMNREEQKNYLCELTLLNSISDSEYEDFKSEISIASKLDGNSLNPIDARLKISTHDTQWSTVLCAIKENPFWEKMYFFEKKRYVDNQIWPYETSFEQIKEINDIVSKD